MFSLNNLVSRAQQVINACMFLVLYVDDILVIGSKLKDIEAVKRQLASEFEMTDVGEVRSFRECALIGTLKTGTGE